MLTVSLSSAEHGDHNELSFCFDDINFSKRATFVVPKDFYASSDVLTAVAVAIRPIACDVMKFDFPISSRAKDIALKSYGIRIQSPVDLLSQPVSRSKTFLNFSGGIDSLAAYHLLRNSIQNVSIDFGGAFAREANWFREWDTYVVETNFRTKPFNESLDWRFMAAPAILFSDYLDIGTICWGTVLEASPFWLSENVKTDAAKSRATHVFEMANVRVAQTVSAISEYGTMKVAASLGEAILDKGIESCAPPSSEKFIRKKLLKKIVLERNIDNDFFERYKLDRKHKFGTSFGADVLTLYFCWRLGYETVERHLADFTLEQKRTISTLNMRFFERINTANIPSLEPEMRGQIVAGYKECGLAEYDDSDFRALAICRDFLGNIHKFK